MRSRDFCTLLGKQWAIPCRRQREGFGPLGFCFSNECVFPLAPASVFKLFSHTIVKHLRSEALISQVIAQALTPRRTNRSYPAAQGCQLKPPGNSRTSLPTWFGDLIPHPSDTVQNPKRDTVPVRRGYSRRLQPCRRHGLLGCCFVR